MTDLNKLPQKLDDFFLLIPSMKCVLERKEKKTSQFQKRPLAISSLVVVDYYISERGSDSTDLSLSTDGKRFQ